MSDNILMIIAPVKSHLLASFYLAKQLDPKHDIYYTSADDILSDLIVKQGYQPIKTNTVRIANGFDPMVLRSERKFENNKVPLWSAFKFYLGQELYKRRKYELSRIIKAVDPKIIFLDIFTSTDFFILKPLCPDAKFVFLNSTFSTYKVEGFPAISETEFLTSKPKKFGLRSTIFFQKNLTHLLSGVDPALQIRWLYFSTGIAFKHKLSKSNPYRVMFEDIPEVLLVPLELEFSEKIKRKNQFYLGLCVDTERVDTEIDISFENRFHEILADKAEGKKILFCSFGVLFKSPQERKIIVEFLLKLVEELSNESHIKVVVSVDKDVSAQLEDLTQVPTNFLLFTKVKQLQMLNISDMFISHGGMGSIKEAIYYNTPLLVYPLDLHLDQGGNALKIEFHNIGLRGDIQKDSPAEIREKVMKILTTNFYKENVKKLRERLMEKYNEKHIDYVINRCLGNVNSERTEWEKSQPQDAELPPGR